tara:strand:+ start:570 stop:755 length:186 start_codon:yes stop_codon:yes gene_type:complete
MLNEKVKKYIISKGIDFDNQRPNWSVDEYRLQDDGAGAYIHSWDETVIGCPKPTQEQLDAL